MIAILFVALAILTVTYIAIWVVEARRLADTPDRGRPDPERIAVGFFANFFDALGIGSFATTTTYYRFRKLVRDELIPGTLNVGHCLPTITQAFIGIAVIAVDPLTLILMIVAAVAGSWYGADVVARMPRRAIQIGMGLALLIAAASGAVSRLRLMPTKRRMAWLSYSASSIPSSDKPKHCWATYIRSMRSRPTGGRPRPPLLG